MLPKVRISRSYSALAANLDPYRELVDAELLDELWDLARALVGVRICHINSTPHGGGVAELLARELPLLHAVGVSAEWRLIHGDGPFFSVTKSFHNALQGAAYDLPEAEKDLYLKCNEESASRLEQDYDVYIVHDPHPVGIRHFAGARGAKWIWRCHIDTSGPNEAVSNFLRPLIEEYDAAVFTMPEFALPGLEIEPLRFIPPAIDPLATKNMTLPLDLCKKAIAYSGIDVSRPMLLQVSRFDPWKDPLGVIRVYRMVKREMPGVQLVLIGAMAGDDPEGWRLLDQVERESGGDSDMFLFTNLAGVGSMEVNVFQRASDVVIQKSLKEGFGLVVSEALWKERPVVAGKTGGIPMQFPAGFESYLIRSDEECAERLARLLNDPEERRAFGRAGHEHVRRHFLLPRLARDELTLIREVL